MKDAERIIDRILFLEGVPNMQRLGAVTIGESVPEQLQIQLQGERDALVLADGIKVSLEEGDDASREFFAGSLLEEEEHADCLETELSLIGQVGEANYLAQQIHD